MARSGTLVNIGVIGCGQWGPNHIRIFSQLSNSRVLMCADPAPERLKAVKEAFPGVTAVSDHAAILENGDIDAVCIASPTATHFAIACEALRHNKHVLCEKPLALHPKECQELLQLAAEKQRILMVGHVFLFHSGIIRLKEYIRCGELGRVYYAHSTRTNLGPFRYDVNALWDLAPHDVSIFNYLFDGCAVNVSARGQKYLGTHLEDVVFATLEYPGQIMANIHVSWLDPKKVRRMTIVGDKKMVVWDDLEDDGPIRLYDKHVEKTSVYYDTYGEFRLLSQEGGITIPKINLKEPLKAQGQYFLECVEKNVLPDAADAHKAMEVVKTLRAIEASIKGGGACTAV